MRDFTKELHRRRRNSEVNMRRRPWCKVYRERIAAGLEHCRRCRSKDDLTFDHIVPMVAGGSSSFSNMTILCAPCNIKKGDGLWRLRSLKDEELAGPADRRWGSNAELEARAVYLASRGKSSAPGGEVAG